MKDRLKWRPSLGEGQATSNTKQMPSERAREGWVNINIKWRKNEKRARGQEKAKW